MYTLLCCADVEGRKVNLEVTLDAPPRSITELEAHLTRVFATELADTRHLSGDAKEPFQIACIFIYDDVLLQWTKLVASAQLHEYDQLYVFQPQTPSHRDTQRDLPPPRPPRRSKASSLVEPPPPLRGTISSSTTSSPLPRRQAEDGWQEPHPMQRPHPTLNTASKYVTSTSPTRARLEQQRREEDKLARRLSSVRDERERLEKAAVREEETERRRRAAATDEQLRNKEREIWRFRDALAKAEQDFQELLAEKKRLFGAPPSMLYREQYS